jgi:hypothetical protein
VRELKAKLDGQSLSRKVAGLSWNSLGTRGDLSVRLR